MSEPGQSADRPGSGWLSAATGFVALASAAIAAGQAASSWITGYFQAQQELIRSQKEQALADTQKRSELAEKYLTLILAQETREDDRTMLLGALGELKDHPLQSWAKARYAKVQAGLDEIDRARGRRLEALALKDETERKKGDLEAKIAELSGQLRLYRENPEKSADIYAELRSATVDLGAVVARLSVAVVSVQVSQDAIARAPGAASARGGNRAEAITALAARITADRLTGLFPDTWRKNVAETAPFLAKAMQEFQISDARVAAVIIATIAVETFQFEAYEEPQGAFNTRDAPFDRYANRLGNTEPGDGAKFRGRGFLGLTGRANYAAMSQRLGLGTTLVDTPEEAKRPEIAARIICAFFVDRIDRVSEALERNDLAAVRRAVAGGSNLLAPFSTYYAKVLAVL